MPEPVMARAFNMCGDVAAPNLDAVAQQNCLQAPDTRMTVMGRRSGSSASNDDVERAARYGPGLLHACSGGSNCRTLQARQARSDFLDRSGYQQDMLEFLVLQPIGDLVDHPQGAGVGRPCLVSLP